MTREIPSMAGAVPAKSRATIRQVASAAGVSIATVSRVLNGRPDVAPQTREAVLRVVRDHGFSTNRNARALSGGRTGLVGVTLPVVHGGHFTAILAGVTEGLYEQDMRAVLCPTLHRYEREVNLLERLLHGTTDAGILMLPEESNEELRALQRQGYPFVVVDPRAPTEDGIAAVSAANASGARVATEHLLALGHRRIGAITGPSDWLASSERLNGFRSALAAAGVLAEPGLVREAGFQAGAGDEAARSLLDLPERPTAIFAFNDELAVSVLRGARERGLRVPDDVSVVGFDDSEKARITTPALTSVRQPLAEMGRMAVTLLLQMLESERVEGVGVELAIRLVERDSAAPPPAGRRDGNRTRAA
jgi:LacI family transcriptional regulator